MLTTYVPMAPMTKMIVFLVRGIVDFLRKSRMTQVYMKRFCTPAHGQPIPGANEPEELET